MRAVLQRVTSCEVRVDGEVVGQIAHGLCILLGVETDDTPADAKQLAEKCVQLRIFDDEQGKMNRSVIDVAGSVLVVSQFTLLADAAKGRRPSYVRAAAPELAESLYLAFCELVRSSGLNVATGRFRAEMQVSLVNSGPVTILLDTRRALLT